MIKPIARAFVRSSIPEGIYSLTHKLHEATWPLMRWVNRQRAYLRSWDEGLRRDDRQNLEAGLQYFADRGELEGLRINKQMTRGECFGPDRPDEPGDARLYDHLITMRRGPSKWVL